MSDSLTAIFAVGCILWLAQALLCAVHLLELRTVARMKMPVPESWPTVSAIVPARDEARSIGAALRSRLADDYPALQLVVVDDRSADGTPEAIAQLAAEDDRVVPLRIEELPEGWLGKVHALDCGVRAATGEWLLISDADVHISPGGLRKAVSYCTAENLDFLALVPEFRSTSFIVDVVWTVFMRVLCTLVSPKAVRSMRSKVAMGSGGFMLAKREVFDRTPGYGALRMETTDDVALGVMMKAAGARCDFANGREIASISIYGSYAEFLRGVEKNAGSMVSIPFPVIVTGIALAGCLEFVPFLAVGSGDARTSLLGGFVLAIATLCAVSSLWVNTRTVVPALLWPLGWLLVVGGVLRAAWLLERRGGVAWRGTFYSREELLAQAALFRGM